jgi:LysM repeat protein
VDGLGVVEHDSPRRVWAARLIAPLAFFAAATIFIVLIEAGLNGGSTDAATTATAGPTVSEPTTSAPTTNAGPRKKKTYRVKNGDTLESIAAKFNTTVDDLLTLNPNVDPLALSPGQKIRVS